MILFILLSVCTQESKRKLLLVMPKVEINDYEACTAVRMQLFYRSFVSILDVTTYKCKQSVITNDEGVTLKNFYDLMQKVYEDLFREYLTHFMHFNPSNKVETGENSVICKNNILIDYTSFDHIFLDRFSDSYIAFIYKIKPEKVPLTQNLIGNAELIINEYFSFVPFNLFDRLESEFKVNEKYKSSWYEFTDRLNKSTTYFNWYNQRTHDVTLNLTQIPFNCVVEVVEAVNLYEDITRILNQKSEESSRNKIGVYHIIIDIPIFFMVLCSEYRNKTATTSEIFTTDVKFITNLLKVLYIEQKSVHLGHSCINLNVTTITYEPTHHEIDNLIRSIGLSEEHKIRCEIVFPIFGWICFKYQKMLWNQLRNNAYIGHLPDRTNGKIKNSLFDLYLEFGQHTMKDSNTGLVDVIDTVSDMLDDYEFFGNDAELKKYKIALLCELIFESEKSYIIDYIIKQFLDEKEASQLLRSE